jgi:hypothetical protein
MRFIVTPITNDACVFPPAHTMCVLCSEDPRWCITA